jgi:pyruvate/oxaloacetate carboxyltransferase
MMLIRGQNLVAYSNFSDDIVVKFVEAAARNGIDVFRIFDALDDVRNHETVVKAVKSVGKTAEGAVASSNSPVHTAEKLLCQGSSIGRYGVDQICTAIWQAWDPYDL